MNHDEYRESVALDALGALDEAEARSLQAHVEGCPDCLREREEMRDVAAALVYAATPVAPPEHLRARLLERVRETATAPAARQTEVGSEVRTLHANKVSETARVLRPPPERFTRTWPTASALTYGALAASVVLAVSLFMVWRENRTLRSDVARLGTESRATRDELARRREELAQQQQELTRAREESARRSEELAHERELAELMTAPQSRMAELVGKEAAPVARASLVYDRATGRAILLASGLPPAPDGMEYQIWYIAAGKPLPGRVFKTDDAGRASLRDQIPTEGRDAESFAVTLEPAGGMPAPTGSMYLLGSVS